MYGQSSKYSLANKYQVSNNVCYPYCSSVLNDKLPSLGNRKMGSAIRIETPYGGRLEWTLPGGTQMFVHLKDKSLIRHRKRWSQVICDIYSITKINALRMISEMQTNFRSTFKHCNISKTRNSHNFLFILKIIRIKKIRVAICM